jgi:hypothetical protein
MQLTQRLLYMSGSQTGQEWAISEAEILDVIRILIHNVSFQFFCFHGTTAPCGQGPRHYRGFTITLI